VDPAKAGTVGPACERWLESYVKQARDEKGQKLAAQRVRAYLDPFFGHMLVERVTREDLRSFQLWLQTRFSLSVTSVWHVLSDVRCLFNWCEDAGLVERSPFPRRVMPKVQERPPDRLTDKASDVKRVRVAGAGEEQRYLEVSHTKSKRVRRVPLSPELAAELRGRVVAWCSMRQAHRDRSRPACAG
jgi:integrase